MCLAESPTIGGEHQQSVNIFLGIILWIVVATQSRFRPQLSGSATAQGSAGPPQFSDVMVATMSRSKYIAHHEFLVDTFSRSIRISH